MNFTAHSDLAPLSSYKMLGCNPSVSNCYILSVCFDLHSA